MGRNGSSSREGVYCTIYTEDPAYKSAHSQRKGVVIFSVFNYCVQQIELKTQTNSSLHGTRTPNCDAFKSIEILTPNVLPVQMPFEVCFCCEFAIDDIDDTPISLSMSSTYQQHELKWRSAVHMNVHDANALSVLKWCHLDILTDLLVIVLRLVHF